MQLNNITLLEIKGGMSSNMLNSVSRFLSLTISVGKMVGSSIRRLFSKKKYC